MRQRNPTGCAPGSARSGGVLVVAMIAVLTVAALAAGMLQLSSAVTKRQASAINTKLAFYMAESGLSEAYAGLVAGHTGNVGTQASPAAFGDGLFWVEASENADGTTTLKSTGMVGNGQAVLSLVVEREVLTVSSLGLFGRDGIEIQPGVTVDGFDPLAESADPNLLKDLLSPEQTAVLGKLGSNGPIRITGTLAAPVTVDGDVTPGPENLVQTTGEVTISGSTLPATEAQTLPPVSVPDMTLGRGVTVDGTKPYTVLPGRTGMQSLVVEANGVATIQGPAMLVLNALEIRPNGTLEFDTTLGPISVYVIETLGFEEGSFVNTNAPDAGQVSIQVAAAPATPFVLASQSEFHGVVYAPDAGLKLGQAFEMYGALVGKTLLLTGSTQLHYDVVLDAVSGELGLPRLVSWRIVELSNPGTVADLDPFLALGLDRSLLDAPADAHEDQLLKISYTNTLGGTATYSGMESGFDWSSVKTVEAISRDGLALDPDAALAREKARIMDIAITDL